MVPQNVIEKEMKIAEKCKVLERELPSFLEGYFTMLKMSVSPKTRLDYLRDVTLFMKALYPEKTLKDIRLEDFKTINKSDINNYLSGLDASVSTVARKKSSLQTLFRQLYRDEILDRNLADYINPTRVPKKKPIVRLSQPEIESILNIVRTGDGLNNKELTYWKGTKYRDEAIIILFLSMGFRLDELIQLNYDSVDLKEGIIKIYRKGGYLTEMPLTIDSVKALRQYFDYERSKFADETALFLSVQGKRMTNNAVYKMIKKYTSMVTKEGISPHKLRSTAASMMIENGLDIYSVQEWLGHKNVTTTQIYAAHKSNGLQEIAKRVKIY